jgi:hypothetical protein
MGGQTAQAPTRPTRQGHARLSLRNMSRANARDTLTTPPSALEQVRQLFSKDSRADLESAAYRVAEALSHATATLHGRQRAFADKLTAAILKEVSIELQGLSSEPVSFKPLAGTATQSATTQAAPTQPASQPAQGPGRSYAQAAATLAPTPQPQPAPKSPLQAPRKDKRIFFSIQNDAALKSASPWEFRRAFCAATGTQDSLFKAVTRTRSGFAALAASMKASEQLLSDEVKLKATQSLKLTSLGLRQPWSQYVVHRVPTALRDLEGDRVTVSEEQISEEVKIKTGISPVKVSASKHPYQYDPTLTSWIISFPREVQPFRLFESSAAAVPYAPKPKITQCDNCLGFHHTPHCRSIQKCHTCGRHAHGDCSKPDQCANCHGPHASQSEDCPARPIIIKGRLQYKTKAQRKALQALGKMAANEAFNKLPPPPQPSAQATPSSPPPEVEMLSAGSEQVEPLADGAERVEPSIDGANSFADAEVGMASRNGYKERTYVAHPCSASSRETRSRRRVREASPAPILDRRTRTGPPAPSSTFKFDSASYKPATNFFTSTRP